MSANGFIVYAIIFLAFSVISVLLSKRFGFGSVLGYLVAGILIGPSAFGLVHGSEDLGHFAELGVVFLLFLIGLELQPKRLWSMKHQLAVLGLGQTVGSTVVLGSIFHFAIEMNWVPSLVAGFALALSSTAFSLQSLIEKGELKTPYGQGTFSVLLMQDIVAIPALALIPALGIQQQVGTDGSYNFGSFIGILIFVAFLIISSRTWVGSLFRVIALHGSREIFTSLTLLLVLGVSYFMHFMGLSMGLGAFLAGVLLADSEYRHEIEVDLEPFKAILMGFFFIAVGITVPMEKLVEDPLRIIGWVAALMAVKFFIMYAVGRFGKLGHENSKRAALYLSLGGEFAFVISSLTLKTSLLTFEQASTINLVVTFSMVLTPFFLFLQTKLDERRQTKKIALDAYDKFDKSDSQIIIAGFGRFGQIFGRILRAQGIPFTAIDHDPDQIQLLRKFGNKVYYGDCSREEILHAAGAQNAKYIVVAIDDMNVSVETVEVIKEKFPNLKIFARARNRQHAYELMDLGISHVKRETIDSGINFVEDLLIEMGMPKQRAHKIIEKFRQHDEVLLKQQYVNRFDEKALISASKLAVEQLEKVMKEDLTQSYVNFDEEKENQV